MEVEKVIIDCGEIDHFITKKWNSWLRAYHVLCGDLGTLHSSYSSKHASPEKWKLVSRDFLII